MSTRAIAPIVGKSARTVAYDAAGVQEVHTSPEPTDDGYPDLLPGADEESEDEPGEVHQPFSRDDQPVASGTRKCSGRIIWPGARR